MRWIASAAVALSLCPGAWAGVGSAADAAAAAVTAPAPVAATADLTAAQIVEKNVAARGGLDAWRKVQTMVWVGHVESPDASAPRMPFVLRQKRPNKTRFEIASSNQRFVRIYDGEQGWKARPARTGALDVQPYSIEELKSAQQAQGIDGPLIDYQAKGIAVTLDGVEAIEGRQAYRLNVRLPSGEYQHVWVDAQTFLDIKYERASYNAVGQARTTPVFLRDFKTTEGLQIPALIETGTGSTAQFGKMIIEKISVNPPLDDKLFAKPSIPRRRGAVTVDTTSAGASRAAAGRQADQSAAPKHAPR
jgi:hypothetical protein